MRKRFKTYWLGGVLVSYAIFSSSTPDQIGLAELSMLAFLILFVGVKGIVEPAGGFLFIKKKVIPNHIHVAFQLLFYVPAVIGLVVNQNTPGNFFRDIVPFVYLFLPLFFLPVMKGEPEYWLRLLVYLLSLVGVSYSIRFFLIDPQSINYIGRQVVFGDMNYFPMDPAVIFTATFLLVLGLNKIISASIFSGSLHLIGGLIAYAAIIGILVRAQIALVLLAVFLNLIFLFGRRMLLPSVVLVILLALVAYYAQEFFLAVYDMVIQKFTRVGLSARDLEVDAVLQNAFSSTWKFLFGEGWGGLIANPSTGYVPIRFVHDLFSYSMFKGGIFGFIMMMAYITWILRQYALSFFPLRSGSHYMIAIKLAIFNALLLNMILEPGYKMFSFGLILCVLVLTHLVMESEKKSGETAAGSSQGKSRWKKIHSV